MSRAFDFHLDTEEVELFDYTRNYYLTRFFNSLSLLFPKGEKFFCNSVRNYEHLLSPDLLEEAKLFYKEEGRHSREHMKLNAMLKDQGFDTDSLEEAALRKLKLIGNNPENALLVTVCLELLTAYGADLLIAFDVLLFRNNEGCHLWRYHAREEAGHGHRTLAHKVIEAANIKVSKLKFVLFFLMSLILIIVQTGENYVALSEL